jgi:hypothetical protein
MGATVDRGSMAALVRHAAQEQWLARPAEEKAPAAQTQDLRECTGNTQ